MYDNISNMEMPKYIQFLDVTNQVKTPYQTIQCSVRNQYIGFIGWNDMLEEYVFYPHKDIAYFAGELLSEISEQISKLMKERILS